jgi:hypothetical protein
MAQPETPKTPQEQKPSAQPAPGSPEAAARAREGLAGPATGTPGPGAGSGEPWSYRNMRVLLKPALNEAEIPVHDFDSRKHIFLEPPAGAMQDWRPPVDNAPEDERYHLEPAPPMAGLAPGAEPRLSRGEELARGARAGAPRGTAERRGQPGRPGDDPGKAPPGAQPGGQPPPSEAEARGTAQQPAEPSWRLPPDPPHVRRNQTVKVKNKQGGEAIIRVEDFDPELYEKAEESKKA